MSISKALTAVSAFAISTSTLGACAAGDQAAVSDEAAVTSGTDSTEQTCKQFNEINERYDDIDAESVDEQEFTAYIRDGLEEMEAVGEAAENAVLATAIDTLVDAMYSSLEAGDGDLEAVGAEFESYIQSGEVPEAANVLDETCDAAIGF